MAVFALRPNQLITTAELVDGVWGDDIPASGDKIIPSYVYRLRQALDGAATSTGSVLARERGGYLLRVDPAQVDLIRVERNISASKAARIAGELERSASLLADAVQAWQGEPLAGLPGPHAEQQRARLNELRLAITQRWIAAEMERGRDAEVIPELTQLWLDNPRHEQFAGQLMRALTIAGRQAEALDVYARTRESLVSDLGIEPSEELAFTHGAILRGKVEEMAPAPIRPELVLATGSAHSTHSTHLTRPANPISAVPAAEPADAAVRCDLPAAATWFIARETELSRLVGDQVTDLVAPRIDVIGGMAGVGKTALALQVAHLLSTQYPDAQLFIDLDGLSTASQQVEPAEALARLLHALGVSELPETVDKRASLWRSTLAGKRAVIVLDNAADAAQIRPLIPGTTGCRIIVTSRRRLVGLDATTAISLDVLSTDAGVALLERIVGSDVICRHRRDTAELVNLCGGLPAAIRIVAARLQHRPDLTPADLLRAGDTHSWLDQLHAEDRAVDAAFAASYDVLPTLERQIFRFAANSPQELVDVVRMASLTRLPATEVIMALEHLADDNLLQPIRPGVYRLHRLLREFAKDLTRNE
jgi:DNA-binding SARP family transcriptional activator